VDLSGPEDVSHSSVRGTVSSGYSASRCRQVVYAKRYPAAATARTVSRLKNPPGYAKCRTGIPSVCSSTRREPATSASTFCSLSSVSTGWVRVCEPMVIPARDISAAISQVRGRRAGSARSSISTWAPRASTARLSWSCGNAPSKSRVTATGSHPAPSGAVSGNAMPSPRKNPRRSRVREWFPAPARASRR